MLDLAVVNISYCISISYVQSVNSFKEENDETLTREQKSVCIYI